MIFSPRLPPSPGLFLALRLAGNRLITSILLIVLGSKSAEDYQHLAENQQLSDRAICPACKSVEKFLLFHYNL